MSYPSNYSQALADHDYWISKAIEFEQKASLYRKRAQAAKDSAEGTPGKTVLQQKEAA